MAKAGSIEPAFFLCEVRLWAGEVRSLPFGVRLRVGEVRSLPFEVRLRTNEVRLLPKNIKKQTAHEWAA